MQNVSKISKISKISSLISEALSVTIYLILLSPQMLSYRKDLQISEIIFKTIMYSMLIYFFGITNPWLIFCLSLESVMWTYAIIMYFNKEKKEKLISFFLQKLECCTFLDGLAEQLEENYHLTKGYLNRERR